MPKVKGRVGWRPSCLEGASNRGPCLLQFGPVHRWFAHRLLYVALYCMQGVENVHCSPSARYRSLYNTAPLPAILAPHSKGNRDCYQRAHIGVSACQQRGPKFFPSQTHLHLHLHLPTHLDITKPHLHLLVASSKSLKPECAYKRVPPLHRGQVGVRHTLDIRAHHGISIADISIAISDTSTAVVTQKLSDIRCQLCLLLWGTGSQCLIGCLIVDSMSPSIRFCYAHGLYVV